MNRSPTIRALFFLLLALIAWASFALFALLLQSAQAQAGQQIQQAQVTRAQQGNVEAADALVEATASERGELQDLMQSDALSLSDILTGAGTDAGVALQVSDAAPESSVGTTTGGAIDFTVQASGTFSKLADALALLEVSPAPTSIQNVDLALVPSASGSSGPWQMTAHIRVLTAAPLSP